MKPGNVSSALSGLLFLGALSMMPAAPAFSAVKEEARLSLSELESFTDRVNALTSTLTEQKLALEQARDQLELVEAEGEEAPEAKALARKEIQGKIRDLEEVYRENEKELETYSARIQESHGYAPQLLGSSAISKTAEKQP